MVREYVATRRREIRIEAGREPTDTFIPRSTRPAAGPRPTSARWRSGYAGNWSPGTLFSLRLSYSGRVVHRISASAGQEAFFEGHAHAFRVLGGYVGDITSTIS